MIGAGVRSSYPARRTNHDPQTAALSLDLVPCFPSTSATSVRSIFHYSKIVLGVLIEVLRFDPIAIRHRLAGKRQVPFILLMRVAVVPACTIRTRSVLPVRRSAAAQPRS